MSDLDFSEFKPSIHNLLISHELNTLPIALDHANVLFNPLWPGGGGPKDPQLSKSLNALGVAKRLQCDFSNDDLRKKIDYL